MWYLILQIILCLLLAFILGYLIARLLKLSSLKSKLSDLESSIDHLQGNLMVRTEKIEGAISSTNKLTSGLRSDFDSLDPKFKMYSDQISEVEAKITSSLIDKNYDGKISDVDERIDSLLSGLNNVKAELKSEIDTKDFDPKINELRNQLNAFLPKDEIDAKFSSFDSNFSSLKNEFKTQLSEKDYDGQINNLQTKFGSYYLKPEVDDKLKQYNANFESQKNELQLKLNKRDDLISELEERINLLENPPKPVIIPKDDDLKRISGVGVVLEKLLHQSGITSFKQVAEFTEEQIEDLSDKLGSFHDRIKRDNWKAQAKDLHLKKYGEDL